MSESVKKLPVQVWADPLDGFNERVRGFFGRNIGIVSTHVGPSPAGRYGDYRYALRSEIECAGPSQHIQSSLRNRVSVIAEIVTFGNRACYCLGVVAVESVFLSRERHNWTFNGGRPRSEPP